jgi:D-inositol-3-phosphate glycosyltransferase
VRIVYIGPVPPLAGGIAHCGAGLVQGLRRAGHEAEIVTWAAQYPRFLYKSPARDESATALSGTRFSLRWWTPWSWWRAGREARGADLLVLPWVTPLQAPAYRTILAAARGVPTLIVVHNPHPHDPRPLDTSLTRGVLRRADTLLTHSSSAASALPDLAPGIPVETSPHPPNLDIEARPLPPHPPFKALFFGLVRAYKGLDIAIDALAILRTRGIPIELTVAGEFWEPVETWRTRISEANLTGAVDLQPGYVPDDAVAELFASHHVVVAPYRSATQSGVVPLASAAGRPTVATPVGGLVEQIHEGENGVLAVGGDAVAFADAIARALDDLDSLAASAVRTAPSWDTVARVVESVARRLAPIHRC